MRWLRVVHRLSPFGCGLCDVTLASAVAELNIPVPKTRPRVYEGHGGKTLSIVVVGVNAEVNDQHQPPTDLLPVKHVYLFNYFMALFFLV
jgi:hypothetical protein